MNQSELLQQAQKGLMHHAYLLYGEGAQIAEETALKIANFFEHGTFEVSSRALEEILIVRPLEGSVGIDAVRGIKQFLAHKPVRAKYKTVLIIGGEYMTPEAQNALLKIMEEPPEYARIFLNASQKERILPTLQSRAHAVHFPMPSASQKKFDISSLQKLISEGIDDEDELDRALRSLLGALRASPVKNFLALRETVKRVAALKSLNVNRRLQLRAIINALAK